MFDRLAISALPPSPAEFVKFMRSEIQRCAVPAYLTLERYSSAASSSQSRKYAA